jgi:outer membrane protein OmpA-like peptidoglycan-associated protein
MQSRVATCWTIAVAVWLGLSSAPASAQTPSTYFPQGHWVLNPGAERSQVISTGEVLAPLRFRVGLTTHVLHAPTNPAPGTMFQLREHLLGAFAPDKRLQFAAQVPLLLFQRPAPSHEIGVGRPWGSMRLGILAPEWDDPMWLAIDVGAGLPGLGQAELTGESRYLTGTLKVGVGAPLAHGVLGFEAEVRASLARIDLRGGAVFASQGLHLRGEFALRGEAAIVGTPHGFVEALGGFRYLVRPLELSLLAGPGYGLASDGFSVRLLGGVAFVSPKAEEEDEPREASIECLEGTPYPIEACPDLDVDRDGVRNGVDECPLEHGPKENAGCPWPDTDRDGLFDPQDTCPNAPGPNSNYGCPEEKKQLAVLLPKKIEILEKVYFEFDEATIKPQSFALLNQVGEIINAHPKLARLRVEGHTDDVGGAEYNLTLSEARARAVKTFLVETANVDDRRLVILGYGFSVPLDTNETEAGRAKNRRVEFIIVDEGDEEGEP